MFEVRFKGDFVPKVSPLFSAFLDFFPTTFFLPSACLLWLFFAGKIAFQLTFSL